MLTSAPWLFQMLRSVSVSHTEHVTRFMEIICLDAAWSLLPESCWFPRVSTVEVESAASMTLKLCVPTKSEANFHFVLLARIQPLDWFWILYEFSPSTANRSTPSGNLNDLCFCHQQWTRLQIFLLLPVVKVSGTANSAVSWFYPSAKLKLCDKALDGHSHDDSTCKHTDFRLLCLYVTMVWEKMALRLVWVDVSLETRQLD